MKKSICTDCYYLINKGIIVTLDIPEDYLFCYMKNIPMNNLSVKACNCFKITEAARQEQIYKTSKISQ